MIDALRSWITAVVSVSAILAVLRIVLPDSPAAKITAFSGSLVLLIALIQPVLRADPGEFLSGFDECRASVEESRAELELQREVELKRIIEEQTAAYISDKASRLGIEITAAVRTKENEQKIPIPWSAELHGQESEVLSQWIAEELGIPQERQDWNETES